MPLYIQATELATYAPMVTIDSAEQAGLCQMATNIAIGYLGWEITQKDFTETVQVNPRNECKLSYPNVTALKSAKGKYPLSPFFSMGLISPFGQPQWEVLDVSLDYLNASTGILWLPGGIYGSAFEEATITYTAGHEDIPELVKQACGLIVAAMWQKKDYAGVSDMGDFDSKVAYFQQGIISPEAKMMLNNYRIVGIA